VNEQRSVSDPDSWSPDLAFWTEYRSGANTLGCLPIRIQGFDDQKLGTNLQLKNFLKREHTALQNMKFLKFFSIFVGHPPGSRTGSEKLEQTKVIKMH
jgi:hypothetical protein